MTDRNLLEITAETISRNNLVAAGDRLLVGVSGGADSLCLLHLLWRLRERFSMTLTAGHINHLMRGEQAEKDARFVADFAKSLGVETRTAQADVPGMAKTQNISLEEAGRRSRYTFLEEMARDCGAASIAMGHTSSDQVETVLLNFLRGSGAEGLAGMPVRRALDSGVNIIRPILDITKQEADDYCRKNRIEWRLDSTNLELFARRNRLRHKLLPALKEEQPALEKILLRQADIFAEEAAFLQALTEEAQEAALLSSDERCIVLSAEYLQVLPRALARRVVRESLRAIREEDLAPELEQVDNALQLALSGGTGKRLDLGESLTAEKEYDKLILRRLPKDPQPPAGTGSEAAPLRARLPIPGEVEAGGLRLKAELLGRDKAGDLRDDRGGKVAFLDAAKLGDAQQLTVRCPRAGDRFRPLGAPGRVKLGDFFTNIKVPARLRSKVLLLCLGDAVVWVAGHRIDEHFKVDADTREVVRVEIID